MGKNDTTNNKEKMEKEEIIKERSLVPADEELKVSGTPNTGTACNSRYIRVRKLPTGSAPVVTVMNAGDKAEILDRVPGFYRIKVSNGDYVGYVASNYFVED